MTTLALGLQTLLRLLGLDLFGDDVPCATDEPIRLGHQQLPGHHRDVAWPVVRHALAAGADAMLGLLLGVVLRQRPEQGR